MFTPSEKHRKPNRQKDLVRRAALAARRSLFENLEERRLFTLAAVGNEFRVNTSTLGDQNSPAVAMDGGGDFVVAWVNAQNNYDDLKGIVAQRFDPLGTPVGTEIFVNSHTTGDQDQVAVAMDNAGGFVVVWRGADTQDGDGTGIFAQRYSSAGAALGGEIQVNTSTTGDQSDPAVAMDSFGNFVVTWTGPDADQTGIFAQKFDSSGSAVGGEFVVNTTTTNIQQNSSISMDSTGNYVVTWESYAQDGDAFGVYAQRINSSGIAQGGEFIVNTNTVGSQQHASVGMDDHGGFVIAFQDIGGAGEADNGIYFRRYSSTGVALGANVTRANTFTLGDQTNPYVGMSGGGDFLIAWTSAFQDDGTQGGVYGQEYNASGVAQSTEFRINGYTTSLQDSVAIAADAQGHFVTTWRSVGEDTAGDGVFAQLYAEPLPPSWPIGIDTQIHTNTPGAQTNASIASDASGDLVVVWQSYYEDGDGFGIFAQRYDAAGDPQGRAFRVNTNTAGDQINPVVSMDGGGGFVIAWESSDGDGEGIFFQRYDSSGIAIGTETQANTTTPGNQSRPDIASSDAGAFVITWQADGDLDGDGSGIFAQAYNNVGGAVGSEIQVNTYTTGHQSAPAIAADNAGDFVITWQSDGQDGSGNGIYAQRFDFSAAPVGSEFHVSTFTTGSQDDPDVAMSSNGDFVIVWTSTGQETNPSVHGQRYDNAGVAQGSEFLVANSTDVNGATSPVVAMDSTGKFVVAWQAYDGDDAGIYAIRYSASGAAGGNSFLVNTLTTNSQSKPAIATDSGGDIAIVWTDDKRDDAGDAGIFGKRYARVVIEDITGTVPLQVNTFTTGNQFGAAIAMDASGDYVIVWHSVNQTGLLADSSYGVYAQRYSANGTAIGGEIHVNTITTGAQRNPTVAMKSDGSFIVAWQTGSQTVGGTPIGGDSSGIFARRFNADGTSPDSSEFRINTFTTNVQIDPSIAVDAAGDFIVTWRSLNQDSSNYGVYARRYDPVANPVDANEFQVNVVATNSQSFPVVAMDSAGDFVIAWMSFDQVATGSNFDIYARRYGADGVATGPTEFLVNQFTTGVQDNPAIAMNANGQFVISWESAAQDGSGFGIYARQYDNSIIPVALGNEFRVNSSTLNDQRLPAVATDSAGDFIITWASNLQDGELYGIYAQRYGANGAANSGETQVNVFTTSSQYAPAVAMDSTGNFVVAWQSGGNQDGNAYGVFARRYAAAGSNPGVIDGHFIWQNKPQRIEIFVDRDVSASLDSGDLQLTNLTTGQTISAANINVTWVGVSKKIIFTFPGAGFGGALPNGEYHAVLMHDGVFDAEGKKLSTDETLDFFFLNGDSNHDGKVDVDDLYAMATHWLQQSNFNYNVGDFNYDGVVNGSDLGILGLNWQMTRANLAPPSPAEVVPTGVTTSPPAPPPEPEEPPTQVSSTPPPADPPPANTPARGTSRAPSRQASSTTVVDTGTSTQTTNLTAVDATPTAVAAGPIEAPVVVPIGQSPVVETSTTDTPAPVEQSEAAPVVEMTNETPAPAPVVQVDVQPEVETVVSAPVTVDPVVADVTETTTVVEQPSQPVVEPVATPVVVVAEQPAPTEAVVVKTDAVPPTPSSPFSNAPISAEPPLAAAALRGSKRAAPRGAASLLGLADQ